MHLGGLNDQGTCATCYSLPRCAHSLRTHLLQDTMPRARHQTAVRLAQVCHSGHCTAGAGPAARCCHHFSTSPRLWNRALQAAVGVGLWPAELTPCSRRATGREIVKQGQWDSESQHSAFHAVEELQASVGLALLRHRPAFHSTWTCHWDAGKRSGPGAPALQRPATPAAQTPERLPQTAARPDTHLLRWLPWHPVLSHV